MSLAAAAPLASAHAPSPIRVPTGMLALCVLLWGWCHDELAYAALVALAAESSRALRVRWDFEDTDFHRLADLTSFSVLLVAVVQFSDRGLAGIYGVLKWFPLALLPLMLAQQFSTRPMVKLSALFLSVRFALRRGRITRPGELDMRAPFLVACLLSATASAGRGPWLIPVESLVLAWLLLANAGGRYRQGTMLVALLLCGAVAAAALAGVAATHRVLEPIIMDIMRERISHWRDPFRSYTSLGEVGQLKASDRIVMRVRSQPGVPAPTLLREATYTHFSRNTWLAGDTRFRDLRPNTDGTRWELGAPIAPFRVVTVAKNLIRNRGMLAVPGGSFRLEELPVEELKVNGLAALKAVNGPALVEYRARYAPGAGVDAAPAPQDLLVPGYLSATLQEFLEESGARGMAPSVVVSRVAAHFLRNFSYSLTLTAPTDALHPVAGFLQHTRSGHCEFFATATVLLLRAAGIPARYASGYSVQEWSPLEEAFVVRRRHSHTWALAYLDGRWVDVDTTPPAWIDAESAHGAWWRGTYDTLSYLWYGWSRWRLVRIGETSDSRYLLWALPPLGAFLAFRIYRSRRLRVVGQPATGPRRRAAGRDAVGTAFRRIEDWLARQGLRRPPALPLGCWLRQLAREGRLPDAHEVRGPILTLHYRACFHPQGLNGAEEGELSRRVDAWLGGRPVARRPSR